MSWRWRLTIACGLVFCLAFYLGRGAVRKVATIDDVRAEFDSGDVDAAIAMVDRVDHENLAAQEVDELASLLGDLRLAKRDVDAALEAFEAVSAAAVSESSRHASMMRGEIYRQRGAFARASNEFQRLVDLDGADTDARLQLVQTLLLGGVRFRAWPHVKALLEQGSQQLLVLSAAATPRAVKMIPFEVRQRIEQGDPLLLIGTTKLYLRQGLHDEAQRFVTKLKALDELSVEVCVLDGWLRYDRDGRSALAQWVLDCPVSEADCEGHAEYWYLRGLAAVESGDHAGAAHCFFETLNLWPDYQPAVFSLAKAAAAVGELEIAAAASERAKRLDDLATAAGFLEAGEVCEHLETAARTALDLGRLREAAAWCTIAKAMSHDHEMHWVDGVSDAVAARQEACVDWVEPGQLLTAQFPWRQKFPAPKPVVVKDTQSVASERHGLRFRNDASAAGLSFSTRRDPASEHLMRYFTGSGVGVIDYDLDLLPDLFFSQNSENGDRKAIGRPATTSQLFRNRRGVAFERCTGQSDAVAVGFGQGVAVGDVDGDGFPDVYVGNVGRNELLLNNGDGTFREVSSESFSSETARWTTSVAIADLDADGHADLFNANYLGGDDVDTRVCGTPDRPRSCSPRSFPPSRDTVSWGTGDAGTIASTSELNESLPGNGLGVVVGSFDDVAGLDVFVANDLTANHLFVSAAGADLSGDGGRAYEDVAMFRGLAYDSEGASQACMGIACSDVNDDGRTDLYVTNFHAERNALYVSEADGLYADVVDGYQPGGDTFTLLGFGAQFLDADLDGDDDLIVTNGHIWESADGQTPYKMPPQLYERVGQRFENVRSKHAGAYFEGEYLGRALARVDWNADGLEDAVVTDLSGPAALLTNVTEPVHISLRVRLVATETHRDAVGAFITVTTDAGTQVRELTVGDGYLCSNERVLTFAVASDTAKCAVSVRWPSGANEEWPIGSGVSVVTLVEGSRASRSAMVPARR